jgi:predicted TIM-barrel fold metal-dependent hydrolase
MIDTHQHLFYPDRFGYSWTGVFPSLQGNFDLEAYRAAAADTGIEGSLFMEVDVDEGQAAEEAAFFCGLADDPRNRILGVVASGRPEQERFEAYLDRISHLKLKGIRRVLHTQPDELSRSTRFRENISKLGPRGMTFDLCVLPGQLAAAAALIDACPEVSFVLDHGGNPNIAGGELGSWSDSLREVARRPNVACKISGLPVHCAPDQVTAAAIRPAVERVVECFGWDRVVWGGDWPVCNLTVSLRGWCNIIREILSAEPAENRQKLFVTNAVKVYSLHD